MTRLPSKPANLPQIEIAAPNHRAMIAPLRRGLSRCLPHVHTKLRSVSLALVGDARMAQLHEQFLSVPGTTDVITFELEHDARGRPTEGEIVVCVPVARREARRRGLSVGRELLLYALHGVLHLSGYDDLTAAEHRRMHLAEDRILTAAGFGRVFASATKRPNGATR